MKTLLISIGLLGSGFTFAKCSVEEIKNVRDKALSSYKDRKYEVAENILSFYYDNECSFYDMAKDSDDVLNSGLWLVSDLMFYRNARKDYLGCLSLEDEVYWSWMVSDPNRHSSKVEKALQTNISVCQDALNKLYPDPKQCSVEGYKNLFAVPVSWGTENELLYEVACIGFKENEQNLLTLDPRDSPKFQSEGMNSFPRLEILYVNKVKKHNKMGTDETKWTKEYKLDPIYFLSKSRELWGAERCYWFTIRFGSEAGTIFLDGGSNWCVGGSARNINRVIAQLDYPFKAQVLYETFHSVK
ncbi:hypothetical protein V9R53_003986 [Vibrio mimicus]